jgi:hypothetical protein
VYQASCYVFFVCHDNSLLHNIGHDSYDRCVYDLSPTNVLPVPALVLSNLCAANLQLAWCDLTGCRNLVEFSSSSTALRQLQAASCGRLYSLTLASAQLQKLILTNCSALSDVHTVCSATMGSCNSTAPSWQRQEGQQPQGHWKAGGKGRRALAALDIKGCSTLSAVAAAKLAAVMAA